jgi:hypothetical protein
MIRFFPFSETVEEVIYYFIRSTFDHFRLVSNFSYLQTVIYEINAFGVTKFSIKSGVFFRNTLLAQKFLTQS